MVLPHLKSRRIDLSAVRVLLVPVGTLNVVVPLVT